MNNYDKLFDALVLAAEETDNLEDVEVKVNSNVSDATLRRALSSRLKQFRAQMQTIQLDYEYDSISVTKPIAGTVTIRMFKESPIKSRFEFQVLGDDTNGTSDTTD